MSYRHYKKYGKKNPVGAHKPPFAAFNPHQQEAPIMRNDNMIITSIDPGIYNCGIYVCCYNNVKKTYQSLYLEKLNFKDESENYYTRSIKVLDEIQEKYQFFSSSHYIIIESQMAISYDNTRMGQHLISYFSTRYTNRGNRPLIIEFNSQAKTRLLNCPKMTKYNYKKWCREKAISLLLERNSDSEKKFIECLRISKKADDMSDTICQMYAWIITLEGKSLELPLPYKVSS